MKKNYLTHLVLLSLTVAFASCNAKKEDKTSSFEDRALTTAELRGNATSACLTAPAVLGTAFNSHKVQYFVVIQNDDTIRMDVDFYTTNCTGSPVLSFSQFGSIVVNGSSSTVTGGSNVTMTLTSGLMSARDSGWVSLLNTNCTGGTAFTLSNSPSVSVKSCSGGGISAVQWYPTTTVKNVMKLSGQTLQMYLDPSDSYGQYKLGLTAGFPNIVNLTLNY